MERGRFSVFRSVGMPSCIIVFESDIVVVNGEPGRETYKLLYGLVGEFLVRAAARRDLEKKLEAIDSLGSDLTATQVVACVDSCRLIGADQVKFARIGPGIRRKRFDLSVDDGRLRFKIDPQLSSVDFIAGLLEPLLGDRLRI